MDAANSGLVMRMVFNRSRAAGSITCMRMEGKDPQLEKGIEEVLKQLDKKN